MKPAARSPSPAAYALIAVAPLCWAGNVVLARGVADTIPPVALAFWRWGGAFVFLLPFALPAARRDWPVVAKHIPIVLFLSFTGITCFNTMLYTAMHTTTAINGALIQTAMPAFLIVISRLFFRRKITGPKVLGVLLCMVGAALVVLRGRLATLLGLGFARGDVIMLAAVVLYALYTAFLAKRPAIGSLSFLLYTFGFGTLMLAPLYAWEIASGKGFSVTPGTLASLLYVALFPSIIAYFCWNRGAETVGPDRTGLVINLIPVFASGLAVLFLGETLRWFHIAGLALIFLGMILFNKSR